MMNCKTISKQFFGVLLSLIMLFSLAACGTQSGNQDSNDSQPENSGVTEPMPSSKNRSSESENAETDNISSDEASTNSKILVAYFSRTGENYNVGVIEKGNTHIIAEIIAEETGANIFEIQPVNPYPDTYDECTDVAREEQNENARPEIVGSVDNMEQYDTVFIGYPIWWGDLPMVVYTFLESYDFSGKTISHSAPTRAADFQGQIVILQALVPVRRCLTALPFVDQWHRTIVMKLKAMFWNGLIDWTIKEGKLKRCEMFDCKHFKSPLPLLMVLPACFPKNIIVFPTCRKNIQKLIQKALTNSCSIKYNKIPSQERNN